MDLAVIVLRGNIPEGNRLDYFMPGIRPLEYGRPVN
jgi:hypothetical protein